MTIRVRHTLDDLHADLRSLPARENVAVGKTVRDTAREGQRLAQTFARETSGEVGKHFPDSITLDHDGRRVVLGGSAWSSVYGQDSALPQGNMDFEDGSGRQTTPHKPHAKSADIVGPRLSTRIGFVYDDLFWPAS